MVRTHVGYAGGTTKNPSYYDLDNHSETVQVEYDPTQASYQDLLDVIAAGHDPLIPPRSRQYASIIFYYDDQQEEWALESKARQEAQCNCKIYTEIVPATKFYLAEDYHEKYRLQHTTETDTEKCASSTASWRERCCSATGAGVWRYSKPSADRWPSSERTSPGQTFPGTM